MKPVLLALLLAPLLLIAACEPFNFSDTRQALGAGPQDSEEGPSRRQRWLIPMPAQRLSMVATLWRPRGPGPFRLAVISHASTEAAEFRVEDPTPRYETLALWLTRHGFAAVLPLRPGHAGTGGPYLEEQGICDNADYVSSGVATAASIQTAIDYMTTQSFVKKDHVAVLGQSAGSWGALALASQNPSAVSAIVNFAGGRGGQSGGEANANCAPDRLVEAAGEFGRSARIPTLWIYLENDSFFGPAISKRMADVFRLGGGNVDYHLLPAFGDDGHLFVTSPAAVPIWDPIVAKFLRRY